MIFMSEKKVEISFTARTVAGKWSIPMSIYCCNFSTISSEVPIKFPLKISSSGRFLKVEFKRDLRCVY